MKKIIIALFLLSSISAFAEGIKTEEDCDAAFETLYKNLYSVTVYLNGKVVSDKKEHYGFIPEIHSFTLPATRIGKHKFEIGIEDVATGKVTFAEADMGFNRFDGCRLNFWLRSGEMYLVKSADSNTIKLSDVLTENKELILEKIEN